MPQLTWHRTDDGWRSGPYNVRRIEPRHWVLEIDTPVPPARPRVLLLEQDEVRQAKTAPTASLCRLEAERDAERRARRQTIRRLLRRMGIAFAVLAVVALFANEALIVAAMAVGLFLAWTGGEILQLLLGGAWDDLSSEYQ